ncbi:MAG: YdcF family protein [Flavobacteriales bacterium]|nr:YdcF family protein [Flavobacteriales bacterium]
MPFEGVQWSYIMQMRVHWAVHLYKQGITKNIVFSGGAVYSPYEEAAIMGLYAEQLGVPRAHILLEGQAEHSTENLFNGFEVARDHGLMGRIGLASDPFQTAMLRGLAKRMERQLHADIDVVPVVFTELNVANLSTPVIDPSTAFRTGFVSIKEREGLFKRLLGTSGANLDWDRARAERSSRVDQALNALRYAQ